MRGEQGAPLFGRWALTALLVAAGTVLLTDANRYLPPVGEKYVSWIPRGGSDLIPSFNAACALLDGQNPYHYDLKKYPDPYFASRGQAQNISYLYPPTHALIYVPVALAANRDFVVASRIQFWMSLVALALLALALLDLARAALELSAEQSLLLLPPLLFVLGLNAGSALGFERGQSDMLAAAACWLGLAAFRRERYGLAAFLVVAGSLLKGYGVLCGAGLMLLGLKRWRATLTGALLAILILLAPVARYLPDALAAYRVRASMYWPGWNNQSFFNLLYSLWPAAASFGRILVVVLSLAVALLSWNALRRSLRDEDPAQIALALGLYGTAALQLVLSVSLNSIAYNTALVLPGALLLALCQRRFTLGAAPWRAAGVGVFLAIAQFGLFAFSWPRTIARPPFRAELPLHAAGMLAVMIAIGVVSFRSLRRDQAPRTAAGFAKARAADVD
jgi:hypothetical protein